jgi:IS5 family transposase
MAFKEYSKNLSFMDVELRRIFGRSRTQQFLSQVAEQIDWKPLERLLLETYPVGKSDFGNRAYQPLMLLKAILLQKWYGIDSDPELENQINDRLSFKVFMGLPLALPSPDHSIICRFRERVGKETLERIHHELLHQFKSKGFSIESGMAVDARLVHSASKPVSKKKLEELREVRKQEESSKAVKFQRDVDSDWTVRDEEPFFGMKEHASIDVESGLVLSTVVSAASEHDTNYFQATVVKGCQGERLPWKVYADKGYCSQANRRFLAMNGIRDGIMRKDQINAKLTEKETQRNRWISKVRYKIEQYFGLSALHQWAGTARFTTLVKEGWDRLLGIVAFNMKRVALKAKRLAAAA